MDPSQPAPTTANATSGNSGIEQLYPGDQLSLPMRNVLGCIPPRDCSPYRLRRVCRSFRGFYAERAVWIRLLRDHLSGTVGADMTMEQARRLCNLALRRGWDEFITGPVLVRFKDSGCTELDLSGKSVETLPEGR